MESIGAISYAIGAFAFLFLTLFLIATWRGQFDQALLVVASAATTLWAAVAAYQSSVGPLSPWVSTLEVLRDVAWILFLSQILRIRYHDLNADSTKLHFFAAVIYTLCLLLLVSISYESLGGAPVSFWGKEVDIMGRLFLSLGGLVLVEQLFRALRPERRRKARLLYIGIGTLFLYDFFLYADAVLSGGIDPDFWDARGVINAIAAPLIAVSVAAGGARWSREVYLSQRVVFQSVTLVAALLYLLLVGVGAQLVQFYGGRGGAAAQWIVLALGAFLLLLLLCPERWNALLRVLIAKPFLNSNYDNGEDWPRLIPPLFKAGPGAPWLNW